MSDWAAISAGGFAVPHNGSVAGLVAELVEMLASPDAQVRDETAFAALATWIDGGVVPDDQLRGLGDVMAVRLGADQVHARSFAALILDVIVSTRNVCEPRWVDDFERWYAGETDVRGHDMTLGWLHAVAHGADLLGSLGRRPDVAPRRMLDLAGARLLAPVDAVWHDQEHDRLAYAIGKTLTRTDLSEQDAEAWLSPLRDLMSGGAPGPVPANVSNTLQTLRMVHLLVGRGIRVSPDEVVAVPHQTLVLNRLADALHTATPWMW
jgi:hypothetical protein